MAVSAAREWQSTSTRPVPLLVCGMAEGADRLVAARALAAGLRLRALLPLRREDYVDDFRDQASRNEFEDLVDRADEVRELAGDPEDREGAYVELGHGLVAAADLLVAVWDGRPARGEGGTANVVGGAIAAGLPVLWIHAKHPHALALAESAGVLPLAPDEDALTGALTPALSPER